MKNEKRAERAAANPPKVPRWISAGVLGSLMSLAACGGGGGGGFVAPAEEEPGRIATLEGPARSSSIAITSDDRRIVVVNRETDSVTVMRVRNQDGSDAQVKLAELAVGQEPRSVAILPNDSKAYVTNGASGTVSVLKMTGNDYRTLSEIRVGTEPRGIAVSPNGTRVFVANHTEGTVSVIDPKTDQVIDDVEVGGFPFGIGVSNDGDLEDADELVYVTQFFAETIAGGTGEGFDDGKQGVLHTFAAIGNNPPSKATLAPMIESGFTADRTVFASQFNPNVHSDIFNPDPNETDPNSPTIIADPQGAFPNQLHTALLRNGLIYVPSIGAGPEPPVKFNVNVQGLVSVIDALTRAERLDLQVNLNDQIKTETQPINETESLDRLFANDIVDIDADQQGQEFLLVSRGGNYVLRASANGQGALDIGAPNGVVRFQTGNIPSGVVMSYDGRRAYTNNEVSVSVTAIDLESDTVLERDIPSGTPPSPGSFEHRVLMGKLSFFTALGMPDDDFFATEIRDIDPLQDRGKASDNAWSSCASCHPDGLADGVTWYFPTGPRQTVPLDAFFSKDNPGDQRISNWSGVRGSITDFNNNSRNVQGGRGFAGDPPNPDIYNHGRTQGVSDALDVMTLWVQTVRPHNMPQSVIPPADGAAVFANSCASCHGGAKWTKSQVVYQDNPAFDSDPLQGGQPLDPGVINAGPQLLGYEVGAFLLDLFEDAGVFSAADPREIRGAGGGIGTTALGGLGFNVPSLLGVGRTAPYFHNGSAQTLADVYALHALGDGSTIQGELSATDLDALTLFLQSIDGRTETQRSETDDFLQDIGQ
ncbi:MAG: beta-propeller fold lactonase family protein [Planctomycetota bacterium]